MSRPSQAESTRGQRTKSGSTLKWDVLTRGQKGVTSESGGKRSNKEKVGRKAWEYCICSFELWVMVRIKEG